MTLPNFDNIRLYNRTNYDIARKYRTKPKELKLQDIDKVRITTKAYKNSSYLVYPEIFIKNKWSYLYSKDDKPLQSIVKPIKINGLDIGNSILRRTRPMVVKWERWIKEWIKENDLNIEIEEPDEENKEIKKKHIKKDDIEESLEIVPVSSIIDVQIKNEEHYQKSPDS